MPIVPKAWADAFTAELSVADEHIPLDRVIARHVEAFEKLRKLGMTWRGIAGLLVRAGARRADGKLISADQLRVSYARLANVDPKPPRSAKRRDTPVEAPPLMAAQPDEPPVLGAPIDERSPSAGAAEFSGDDSKDISSSELQSALLRLGKLTTKGTKQ